MLVAGNRECDPGPRNGNYLFLLRGQRISTVIRPTSGRTKVTSIWTICWPSFPLRMEGPVTSRAFLKEASKEGTRSSTFCVKETLL